MRTQPIRHVLLLSLFVLLLFPSFGQQNALYMSPEFKQAYEKGTRKWDGSVSESYAQNRSKYTIKAKVNPATRKVDARASIVYYNNFPETLISLGFHAYKDLYAEGMVVKSLIVNGEKLDIKNRNQIRRSATHYGIYLGKNPLEQGDSVLIEVEWSITIPASVDRDGAYDKTSMMVAYWYPEIAVYDDIFGWDMIDFDGSAEFYHDVSAFDVEIEMPDNFVIWASDAPINPSEIYPAKILSRLEEARGTNEKVEIVGRKDLKKGLKMAGNSWKYSIDSIADFSFSFSDHYLWEAATYTDKFGTYFLNSAYPAENESFSHVLGIESEALQSFHTDFPAYAFPYKHFVAFNGETGGGMEFPGMCNNQARENYRAEGIPYSDYEGAKLLTFHEMMHMYFPFLMGINEKRFAWMDEGMAEFSEDFFTDINLESYRDRSRFASSENPPLMVQTYTIPKTNGVNSYDISSQSYHALMMLLGKETFTKCMQGYIDRWKYKHPSPYDFMFTFNDLSGQDLNWFWKNWYFDWGYPDVAITKFENRNLTIENTGGRAIAVNVVVSYADKTSEIIAVSPAVWKDASSYQTKMESEKTIVSIELKTLNGPDAIGDNNKWVAK